MKKLFLSSSFKDVAPLLIDFVKEDIKGKTVTFIPTASINEKVKFYVGSARKAFERMGVIVDELELTKATSEDILNKLKQNDYIYISGGNTFFLLQELKKSGADKIIIDEINSGKLYIGESAGAVVVSPNIEYVKDMDDCKMASDLDTFTALKIVDFYPVPHYTNFPFAKAVEKIVAKYESELDLYAISNSQAILVDRDDIQVVSK